MQPKTETKIPAPPAAQFVMPAEAKFVRAKGAAELLGVTPLTVWRWSRNPEFPRPRRLGARCTVFSVREIEAWRDARAVEAAA